MVWLKIRKHDIKQALYEKLAVVVVWLKIRKHDIPTPQVVTNNWLWFD